MLLDPASEIRQQIAVLHVDLVNQCLELAVIQAAGEDGVDDLYLNRHDRPVKYHDDPDILNNSSFFVLS